MRLTVQSLSTIRARSPHHQQYGNPRASSLSPISSKTLRSGLSLTLLYSKRSSQQKNEGAPPPSLRGYPAWLSGYLGLSF
jgi:hypothetical protein